MRSKEGQSALREESSTVRTKEAVVVDCEENQRRAPLSPSSLWFDRGDLQRVGALVLDIFHGEELCYSASSSSSRLRLVVLGSIGEELIVVQSAN